VKPEILYGIHPVLEALRARRRTFHELYVIDQIPRRLQVILNLAEVMKIPVKMLQRLRLTATAGSEHHQGIAASVSAYPTQNLVDILNKTCSKEIGAFLLLLDNVLDPHNLGALVRTALCAGIDGIVIPQDRSASPTPAVSRASAGAMEHIALVRVNNLTNTIKRLKEQGIWVCGLDQHAARSVFSMDFKGPVAIVIGGEEKGIRPLVKKTCDVLIRIPQQGPVSSLNASVAGAVAVYEAFRQRCGFG